MQLASFNEFVLCDKFLAKKKSKFTTEYLDQINKLIDVGYIDEFIMKQFFMVMIVPENHKFDFDGYEKWIAENKINIEVNNLFYVIAFGQKG